MSGKTPRAALDGYAFACCDLDPLIPKSNQNTHEPKYICDRNWVKFPSLVIEIWCSHGFEDTQTHSWTDTPENSMPPAPKVFGAGRIKIVLKVESQGQMLLKSIISMVAITHVPTRRHLFPLICGHTDTYGQPRPTRGSAIAEEPRDALRQLKYYGRFLTEVLTRTSANPEEPCEHTVSWNRAKCPTNVQRSACENVCNRWMTFKVIQGHCRCHHLIGHILFHISLPL